LLQVARQKINIYIHVFNLTINLEVVDNIHDNKDHEMLFSSLKFPIIIISHKNKV